jgi:hypothetical protein
MKKIVTENGQKIIVTLTLKERDLILNCIFLENYLIEMLKIALIKNNQIIIPFTVDELEDLLGYIAAEANHSDDINLVNRLEKLYDKLDELVLLYGEI